MGKKLSTGDLIDMMGARLEMVARMGPNENDTVSFAQQACSTRTAALI